MSKSNASQAAVGYAAAIDSRPFTWRAHEPLVLGGVDTYCNIHARFQLTLLNFTVLGPKATTFSSTTDYFAYVADADLQQLHQQPSSVDDETDARKKLIYWETFKSLVSRQVIATFDSGPFKLICDDFGSANMIVNNEHDLEIVGVIDWEWSYAGPCQLICTPPHWLLLDSPNNWFEDDDSVITRYEKSLEIYLKILKEEEESILVNVPLAARPSVLMRECQKNGRMWLHCIIRQGFNGPDMFVWDRLRNATPDFNQLAAEVSEESIAVFIKEKMRALEDYSLELDKKQGWFDQLLSTASQS